MSIADNPHYQHRVPAGRRTARSSDIALTLRAARERLTMRGALAPNFDRELLAHHATALQAAAVVLPLPVIITGFGLSLFVGALQAAVWTLVALGGYLGLILLGRRFTAEGTTRINLSLWKRLFLIGHIGTGLVWAYLAGLRCDLCVPFQFDLFQFIVVFMAVAMTAMISATLKWVVPLTFLPLALIVSVAAASEMQPMLGAMKAVVIGSIPFFAVVAETLRRGVIERIKHQSEKDELITELEVARGLSEEARQRAEDANLAKSRFLATMSHELRTPLNAILGFSEVMQKEIMGPLGSDAYKEYVQDIHSSGEHLLGLINEILDLSRVEAGRYQLDEEAVELDGIARSCLGFVKGKAEAKGLRLLSEFEPDLPAVWADERSIRQIIINLLSNAVKFTPRGGEITLTVGWTAGGGQYVSVRDNGPGIPEEEIPIVLSSFGQGSIAIKSAEQGTGLGLPIVQALISMHDGRFDLKSKLREGTEAIVTLPNSRILELMPAFESEL